MSNRFLSPLRSNYKSIMYILKIHSFIVYFQGFLLFIYLSYFLVLGLIDGTEWS